MYIYNVIKYSAEAGEVQARGGVGRGAVGALRGHLNSIYIYIYIYVYISLSMSLSLSLYIYIYIHLHPSLSLDIYVYICILHYRQIYKL